MRIYGSLTICVGGPGYSALGVQRLGESTALTGEIRSVLTAEI